jgi:hypothetical protein
MAKEQKVTRVGPKESKELVPLSSVNMSVKARDGV